MANKFVPPKKESQSTPQKKQDIKPSNRKGSIMFWRLFLLGILTVIALLGLTSMGVFGYMPSFAELESPSSLLAAEVYSADGKTIGKFYKQNRTPIEYKDLPPNLVDALIATEDVRFYQHSGIDARAIGRAVSGIFTSAKNEGGGSTLSQQLAKNLFPRDTGLSKFELVFRKIKEWIIAVKLENRYTKEELIAMYFNTVDFINTATGIKSAAKVYFNKETKDLNLEECATLVGMVQNPVYLNPLRRPALVKDRRNIVLSQMVKYGKLKQADYEAVKNKDLVLDFNPALPEDGIAPYFREFVRKEAKKWCSANINPKTGKNYDIYLDGLRIYTTLDSRMQVYAEEAVRIHISDLQRSFNVGSTRPNEKTITDGVRNSDRYKRMIEDTATTEEIVKAFNKKIKMKVFAWNEKHEEEKFWSPIDSVRYYEKLLHTGFMAMDPASGHIKAWVGGVDYKYFQYDHVNPNAKRQVGSTFKPFVYTLAIDNGFSPCYKVVDRKYCIGSWCPYNSDGGFSGAALTLKQALTKSKNSVSAYLMLQLKPDPIISLVSRMGIDTRAFKHDATICLGTQDISIYEMVAAYSTYANHGIYSTPVFITRIEDKNGNIIKEFRSDKKEILSEKTAYIMTNMMESVVDFGTAKKLRNGYGFKVDLAGKTGTTQDNADGWFMGFTPRLVAGAWVGADNRQVHFQSTAIGQGASTALPIWAIFMKKVYADKRLGYSQLEKFDKPTDELSIELDCSKYQLADPFSKEYQQSLIESGGPSYEQVEKVVNSEEQYSQPDSKGDSTKPSGSGGFEQ